MALNAQQLEAVNTNDRTVLVLAGAGAGKSTVLVSRIARLVNGGVDPKSILALTFTNAAAFEMGNKYKKLPGIDLTKDSPEFRTFHGFCYSLLIKDKEVRTRLGYDNVPGICDDKQLKEIRMLVKQSLGIKLPDDKLSGKGYLTKQEQFEVDTFKKALVKELRKQNVITFDMLCYNTCELFERDELCIRKYKSRYKYLLCDECQDTDPRQFRFLASFPETTSIFLVGDALQQIYAFRGTSNKFIKMLSSDPNWTVIRLATNYRSTNQICDFANKFSKTYASNDYRIEMNGVREGEEVEVITGSFTSYKCPVDTNHLSILCDYLKKDNDECAILCRTNNEAKNICSYISSMGFQYTTTNKTSDTLDILNSVLDDNYMLEWLANNFLDAKQYGNYIRLSYLESKDVCIRWFLAKFGNITKVHDKAKLVSNIRVELMSDHSYEDMFNSVTKMLKIKTRCKFNKDKVFANARELAEDIKSQVQVMADSSIYVGTIHSSKGLEYNTVYVIGVDNDMFKLGTEDMNNLYYVAMTRAKNRLRIFRR